LLRKKTVFGELSSYSSVDLPIRLFFDVNSLLREVTRHSANNSLFELLNKLHLIDSESSDMILGL